MPYGELLSCWPGFSSSTSGVARAVCAFYIRKLFHLTLCRNPFLVTFLFTQTLWLVQMSKFYSIATKLTPAALAGKKGEEKR